MITSKRGRFSTFSVQCFIGRAADLSIVQSRICHFVSCSHAFNMKNLFLASLVVFNILLNKQAICIKLRCKDIVDNSALSRLKEYLFCEYNPNDRMLAKNNATVVNFGLNLHQFQVVSNFCEPKFSVSFGFGGEGTNF